MKFAKLFIVFVALIVSLSATAGIIFNNSVPAPTGYTLTDIYNLIHNNATSTHDLFPSVNSNTTSSYSVSQIYADLANLIQRGDIATGTIYLGVDGAYGNYIPDRATTTIISSTLTPQGSAGSVWGYSLEDIYQLITNNSTTTAGNHLFTPDTLSASSMHSLTDIYNVLESLIDPTKVKSGVIYLGKTGTYVPLVIYTVTFDQQGATASSSPTIIDVIEPATTVGTLPTSPTKDTYIFSGWYTEIDGGGTEFIETTLVNANITVYAKWSPEIVDNCSHSATDPDCWSSDLGGSFWGPTGTITGAISDTDGMANTINLEARGSAYAAYACYHLTEGGYPVGTWYLPAKNQLISAYNNSVSGFPSYFYWSSTEDMYHPDNFANSVNINFYHQNFTPGTAYGFNKHDGFSHIRCLR